MRYRTEGIQTDQTVHDTGTYDTLEEALLGLQRTMKDFNHGAIKENADRETTALINMWREHDSPVCYTRIHFERIEMYMANKKGVPGTPSTPQRRIITK